jgi:hypothetical protein
MSQVVNSREDAVRLLAYQLWEQAGSPEGDGVNFWLEAEAEFEADVELLDEDEANLDSTLFVRAVAAK